MKPLILNRAQLLEAVANANPEGHNQYTDKVRSLTDGKLRKEHAKNDAKFAEEHDKAWEKPQHQGKKLSDMVKDEGEESPLGKAHAAKNATRYELDRRGLTVNAFPPKPGGTPKPNPMPGGTAGQPPPPQPGGPPAAGGLPQPGMSPAAPPAPAPGEGMAESVKATVKVLDENEPPKPTPKGPKVQPKQEAQDGQDVPQQAPGADAGGQPGQGAAAGRSQAAAKGGQNAKGQAAVPADEEVSKEGVSDGTEGGDAADDAGAGQGTADEQAAPDAEEPGAADQDEDDAGDAEAGQVKPPGPHPDDDRVTLSPEEIDAEVQNLLAQMHGGFGELMAEHVHDLSGTAGEDDAGQLAEGMDQEEGATEDGDEQAAGQEAEAGGGEADQAEGDVGEPQQTQVEGEAGASDVNPDQAGKGAARPVAGGAGVRGGTGKPVSGGGQVKPAAAGKSPFPPKKPPVANANPEGHNQYTAGTTHEVGHHPEAPSVRVKVNASGRQIMLEGENGAARVRDAGDGKWYLQLGRDSLRLGNAEQISSKGAAVHEALKWLDPKYSQAAYQERLGAAKEGMSDEEKEEEKKALNAWSPVTNALHRCPACGFKMDADQWEDEECPNCGEVVNNEQQRDERGRFGPGGPGQPEGGEGDGSAKPAGNILSRLSARVDALANKIPVLHQIKDAGKRVTASIHAGLEKRYGPKVANAIMGGGFLGGYGVAAGAAKLFAFPGVPFVNDAVAIGVLAGAAEIGLQARRAWGKLTGNERGDAHIRNADLFEDVDVGAEREAIAERLAGLVWKQLRLHKGEIATCQDAGAKAEVKGLAAELRG